VLSAAAFFIFLAGSSPEAAFEQAIAAAEQSLREGDVRTAEARYRSALAEGWLLIGTLERLERRMPEARLAFEKASAVTDDNPRALQSLALVHLLMGEPRSAVEILMPLAGRDVATRRLLAQALIAAGQPAEALQELQAARAAAPEDLELAFALAGAYLRMGQPERAAPIFQRIVQARPLPETHLLIGRTYREFGRYDEARAELTAALEQEPGLRHAHYDLGLVAATQGGRAGLSQAIREFEAELALDPRDPLANLELGIALVESQRAAEALPALELAVRSGPQQSRALYYLGRARLAADRTAEAAASLRRALELAQAQGANAPVLRAIHTQLGQALRKLGKGDEASVHFAESARLSAEGTDAERESLARYLADAPDPARAATLVVPVLETSPLAELPAAQRQQVAGRVKSGLARAYSNLGVIQAQSGRFSEAAESFEQALGLDPGFPRASYSLGIAYFNAREYAKATGPLSRALEVEPTDVALKRMLALASLESGDYARAAELLEADPERARDPSLQTAYALAVQKLKEKNPQD
jgi:tetratricopeptide (TPR) repeat protein